MEVQLHPMPQNPPTKQTPRTLQILETPLPPELRSQQSIHGVLWTGLSLETLAQCQEPLGSLYSAGGEEGGTP